MAAATDSGNVAAASLAVPNERTMTLPDGRTLAYACAGDQQSLKVVVLLHGVFGVGNIEEASGRQMAALGWRQLAPTLPGWGRSSPWPAGAPLADFAGDVQALLHHVLDGAAPTHLVFFGGSYGSLYAYACAANRGARRIEPAGAVRGLLVLGGFSPYADDDGYAAALQGMTTLNWLTVGRPSQRAITNWIHPLVGRMLRNKLVSGGLNAGLDTIRMILTGPRAMKPEERAVVTEWAEAMGTTFDAWEASMARNAVLSVRDTLEGYCVVPQIINSAWGFAVGDIAVPNAGADTPRPPLAITSRLDVPAVLPPFVVGGALRDHLAPIAMQRWVAAHIPGALMVEFQGNHIAGITSLFPLLAGIIRGIEAADASALPA